MQLYHWMNLRTACYNSNVHVIRYYNRLFTDKKVIYNLLKVASTYLKNWKPNSMALKENLDLFYWSALWDLTRICSHDLINVWWIFCIIFVSYYVICIIRPLWQVTAVIPLYFILMIYSIHHTNIRFWNIRFIIETIHTLILVEFSIKCTSTTTIYNQLFIVSWFFKSKLHMNVCLSKLTSSKKSLIFRELTCFSPREVWYKIYATIAWALHVYFANMNSFRLNVFI